MPTTTKQTFPERVQLEAIGGHASASVGVTVKSGFVVKSGDVVGKITAGNKYRRRTRGSTAGTGFSAASPVGQMSDAGVFADGDVIKRASDGANIGTVAVGGINTGVVPNTITLTANAAIAVAPASTSSDRTEARLPRAEPTPRRMGQPTLRPQ